MGTRINRRQLLVAAGAGAVGTAAALGAAPLRALASEGEEGDEVEGSWYVSVKVTSPSPASFDATYGFAKGGCSLGSMGAPTLLRWAPGSGPRTEG